MTNTRVAAKTSTSRFGLTAPTSRRFVAKEPMIAASLSFASGIIVEPYVYHSSLVWLLALCLLGIAAVLLRKRPRIAYAITLFVFCCTGAFVSQAERSRPVSPATIMQHVSEEPVTIIGTVMRDGIVRNHKIGSPDESVDIATEHVVVGNRMISVRGGVRLSLYVPSHRPKLEDDGLEETLEALAPPPLFYGQRIRLSAKLHVPSNYKNPGAFDYVGYLQNNGINLLGSAKLTTLEVLPGLGRTRAGRLRAEARRSIIGHIHRIWPMQQAALFDAMLIGEKAFLSRGTRDEFQRSGTYHILVVSGMNVSILAVAFLWWLRRVNTGAFIAAVLTALLTLGYAMVTDLGAPVLRSVLMLVLYQTTKLFYRERAALNMIGTSALVLMVWDPSAVFDPSFQLTFLSVLAITGIAMPLIERTSQRYRRALEQLYSTRFDQALAPKQVQWRIDLRLITSRAQLFVGQKIARFCIPRMVAAVFFVYDLVLVSLLMQVSLSLPMAWYFHRVVWRAVIANIAVVPLTGVLMPASVLAVGVAYFSTVAARPFVIASAWALEGITYTVHHLGKVQLGDFRIATPEATMCFVWAAAFGFAIFCARRHRAIFALGLALLACSAAWLICVPPRPQLHAGVFELTAIDVGQGESLLIVSPTGKLLLLDSGGIGGFSRSEFDIGEEVTSPYLWNRGISHLDAVAFSHPHADHIGGMRAIIENFHPREILYAERNLHNQSFTDLLDFASRHNLQLRPLKTGTEFDFGGLNFRVVGPPRDMEFKERQEDDSSLVLRVGIGNTWALLPGDIHKKTETDIVDAHTNIRADLLKIPHHGSKTSTSPEFLAKVHPSYAVISAGVRNQFHHPRPEILERLQEAGVRTYRTDLFGPTTFYLDGKHITPALSH